MRTPVVVAVTFLAVGLIACSGSSTGTGTGGSSGTSGTTTGTSGGATSGGAAAGAPECGSACSYYLQCKGSETPSNQATCVKLCTDQGVTSAQLQSIEGLDCPSYVSAFDGSKPPASSGTSGGSSGGDYKQSKDCAFGECVRDGASCVHGGSLPGDCPAACCE